MTRPAAVWKSWRRGEHGPSLPPPVKPSYAQNRFEAKLPDAGGPCRAELAAHEVVRATCWPHGHVECVRCHNPKVYRLADNRLRCPECRYTFHDFSRRWLNTSGLSCLQWVQLLQLFAQEDTANQVAGKLGLSYNTVYKAMNIVRLAILASAPDGARYFTPYTCQAIGLSEQGGAGRVKFIKPVAAQEFSVFGVRRMGGLVRTGPLERCVADTFVTPHFADRPRLWRVGRIFFSGRYRQWEGVAFSVEDSMPEGYLRRLECSDSTPPDSDFWRFCIPRLARHHGVSSERLPLYLKELEFRYNHRSEPLFPILLRRLCEVVPEVQ